MGFLSGLVMVAKAQVGSPKATRPVLLANGAGPDRTPTSSPNWGAQVYRW